MAVIRFSLLIIVWLISNHLVFSQDDSLRTEFVQYKDSKGHLVSEGTLVNGKPDGYWKTYYPDGTIKSEGNRENFQLNGTWVFYSEQGDTMELIDYRANLKNGYHIRYEYNKGPTKSMRRHFLSKELYLNDLKENKSQYYQGGKLYQEINFEHGEKQGICRQFDEEGRIVRIMNYRKNVLISTETINQFDKNGLKTGVWKDFYPSGELHVVRSYRENKLDGLFREYTVQGQLIRTIRYADGEIVVDKDLAELPVTYKKEFYASGKVKKSGGYIKNIPVGLHQEFDEQGKVIAAIIYDDYGVKESEGLLDSEGRKTGEWKEFWDDGAVRAAGSYKEGKKTGKWVYYFLQGTIEQEGYYLDGKFSGNWKWYYDTGELWRDENYTKGVEDGDFAEFSLDGMIIEQGVFEMGLKEGQWVMHVGDHIEKGVFSNGLKEGHWKYYYSNEKIKFEGDFIQGQEDGKHLWFFENGKLNEERHYMYGSREKTWKMYNDDGTLYMTVTYRNNKEHKINGKVLEKE